MQNHPKADIIRGDKERNLGIYTLSEDEKLIIIDVPTTLNSIREYLLDLPKFKDQEKTTLYNSPVWLKREKVEIQNFAKVIRTQINASPNLFDKVKFIIDTE